MEERLLIAFIPQKKVIENLAKIRKIAGIKNKNNSAPHITIIDNSYLDIKKVDRELKEIADMTHPFIAKIQGLDTFVVKRDLKIERYRKNNSLIYLIKNNHQLKRIRKEILFKLDYLKTPERINQWIKENPKISKKALSNIKKYGTPFGLKEWKFHITIGLIPKAKKKKILYKIHKLDLENSWIINNFGLFIRKKGWIIYKKYQFNLKNEGRK
jgi:hypothetical protein